MGLPVFCVVFLGGVGFEVGRAGQVRKRAVQVLKQGRNLHRESAFCMALVAQVPALKLNLHHLCRDLRRPPLNLRHLCRDLRRPPLNLRHLCRDLRGKFSYIKIIETTKLWQGLPKYGFA